MSDMSQMPVRFGAEDSLVGMLTTPVHQVPATASGRAASTSSWPTCWPRAA